MDQSEATELSVEQAYAIAEKVVEMADRVRRIAPAVPGTSAKWAFEMDDDRFSVTVEYAGKAEGGA